MQFHPGLISAILRRFSDYKVTAFGAVGVHLPEKGLRDVQLIFYLFYYSVSYCTASYSANVFYSSKFFSELPYLALVFVNINYLSLKHRVGVVIKLLYA